MENNPNQPREYDVVLGGQNPVSDGAVVLGGIEGVKMRLASADVTVRIAALSEALKYEEAGLDLLIQALDKDCSTQVQWAAYWLLLTRLQNKLPSFEFETVTVNKQGEIVQRETKQAKYFIEDLGNGVTLEMVYIPGGTFLMGSPEGEGENNEKPQHKVTVQPFFMGKFQVTQAQWKAVASLQPSDLQPEPAFFKGDYRPVERVSWVDAVKFCWRLSQKTGREYRLPSEAEWEYACRAGTTTPFYFGETITTDLANYGGKYGEGVQKFYNDSYGSGLKGVDWNETLIVGQFPPNAFGLYDMHGNVDEWCEDIYYNSYENALTDGSAQTIFDSEYYYSPQRGGSWLASAEGCRSASRNNYVDRRYSFNEDTGFRVVCDLDRTC